MQSSLIIANNAKFVFRFKRFSLIYINSLIASLQSSELVGELFLRIVIVEDTLEVIESRVFFL